MPIDLNLILASFAPQFKPVWQKIVDAMESIGKDLNKRVDTAEALERASRDYPMLTFQENAVLVSIGAHQKGLLGRAPVGPFLPASIRQELLLPGLADRLRRAIAAVRDSLARFQTPTPAMFTGNNARFSDTFGLLGMLVRSFVHDYRPVRFLEATVAGGMRAYREIAPASGGTGDETAASGTAPASSGDAFEQAPVWIAGALLLVPAFIGWLDAVAREASLGIRIILLDKFQGIQARVFAFRQEMLGLIFETLRSTAQKILELMFAVRMILVRSIVYYGWFIDAFLSLLGQKIQDIIDPIRSVLHYVFAVADVIAAIGNWIRDISLLPGVTIGDILDHIEDAPGWIMTQLDLAERATRNNVRLNAMVAIVRALVRAGLPAPRGGPRPVVPALPDLYRTALAPYQGRLFGLLHDLRDATVPGVTQILSGATNLLNGVGDTFARLERSGARAGSPAVWAALRDSSDRITQGAFGRQSLDRSIEMTVYRDDLAQAFDRQVLAGGMAVIQAAIPRYIGGVVNWWREHRSHSAETPTSPHILARRARLSRVRMPRLTFEARGYDMENEGARQRLLTALEERMKECVGEAWATGELQVARA